MHCYQQEDSFILQRALNAILESLLRWLSWVKGEPEDYRTKIDTLRNLRGSFDLGRDLVYGIFDLDETEVIGGCGLHTRAGNSSFEIGYRINKIYQNKGYATEITRALVNQLLSWVTLTTYVPI
jgi:RimJ/RimL family protein N-acetyltransferase